MSRELTICEREAAWNLHVQRHGGATDICDQCRADIVRLVDAPPAGERGEAVAWRIDNENVDIGVRHPYFTADANVIQSYRRMPQYRITPLYAHPPQASGNERPEVTAIDPRVSRLFGGMEILRSSYVERGKILMNAEDFDAAMKSSAAPQGER